MSQRLMTPSKVTAWLECAHYLTLRSQVDSGHLAEPDPLFGSFARLLADKGLAHEQDCLAEYRRQGLSVLDVPQRLERETFSAWAQRVGNPLDGTYDVVYQMPFIHDGIRGIADFVVRVADPETGAVSYEPVDAKLTRVDAKPGHVLQLCFYADAIEALTNASPRDMHIWLGSGRVETLQINQFRPYWRRLRKQLAAAMEAGPAASTEAQRCEHCFFCEFNTACEEGWRAADSLIYVANIRQNDIAALTGIELRTLAQLAEAVGPVEGVDPVRLSRLVSQAALQVHARNEPSASPPFMLIPAGGDQGWGRGLEQLPEPDDGDVFLDFEGHPFWRVDAGLFFLFGLLERDDSDSWTYLTWWAHDRQQEAAAVVGLVDHLARRRERFPKMHVYHYNHTERSALQTMATTHRVAETELAEMVDTGAFVDLYRVALNGFQVGAESYGLKYLERLTDFERSHDIDQGAGAVLQYEHYMAAGDDTDLVAIAVYNEDDVRATLALRDWLVAHRPAGIVWREAVLEREAGNDELDERVARLHEFGAGTMEYFLGDLLGYWRREWLAYVAPKMSKLGADPLDLLDDPDTLAVLQPVGEVERLSVRGTPIAPAMRLTFPPQAIDRFPPEGGAVVVLSPEGNLLFPSIARLDPETGEVDFVWGEKLQEAGFMPRSAVLHDWVNVTPKALALQDFADTVLEERAPNEVTMSLLRRDLPKFTGPGPVDGIFTDDLGQMSQWVTRLDHSCVAIQGPPGAGKTHNGAHLIYTLIMSGSRVGITATSHVAIVHLMEKVISVFAEEGHGSRLNAVRNASMDTNRAADVTYGDNNLCARMDFNLVAGTTWLFCSNQMQGAPVDVLVIDEAGQLSLADALAASRSARNMLLLGDPLQLPQVAQAAHPDGSGVSVLEHVVGDEPTLSDERGVFLTTTWRMHPDVCDFISDLIYDGRLTNHPNTARQSTSAGTGLRWVRAEHEGHTTSSAEEADLIAEHLHRLLGTDWVDFDGNTTALGSSDFMVVAPYNDQVRVIRDRLAQDDRTAAVPVGTVDKFQGKEAAIVFFSMTTSNGEEIVRGMDFLFSRNRLNVAVSRARCLAYLVCTEELLNTRARNIADMRLLATLNAFVERAAIP